MLKMETGMFKIAICDDNPKDIEVIKIIVEKFLDEKELSYFL